MAVPAGSSGERLPVRASAANLMVAVDVLVVSRVLIESGRALGASIEAPSPSARIFFEPGRRDIVSRPVLRRSALSEDTRGGAPSVAPHRFLEQLLGELRPTLHR